jgi:HK97 family phage major capsid protein
MTDATQTDQSLAFFGDSIKAIGNGKVAGFLVRYSSEQDPDVTADYFDKNTDYGVVDGSTLPVYYRHGMDEIVGSKSIGRGKVKFQDTGIWFEAQLNMRKEYERLIYELAEAGKLGWSSQAGFTIVEKEPVGKSFYIKSWPIAEASLTPTPAEPRNNVITIKSLITAPESEPDTQTIKEVNMTEEEQKVRDESLIDQAVEKALKAYSAAHEPEVRAGYQVEVVEDEADKAARLNPFKSDGEYFSAVKSAELSPSSIDKRLLPLKAAAGLNEATPSDGGFLVPQQTAAGILEKMWTTGSVLSRFNPTPVVGNNLSINVVDESSRADGYRHGGVLGYWLAEAGTKTASQPKFRQLNLKLKKVAALCYATDELLDDTVALGAWLNKTAPDELRFQVEAALINGNGVGKPLGILQSPALLTLARIDANEIDAVDVTQMWAHRYAGANDYVWFVSSTIFPQLANMTIGQSPMFFPAGGLSGLPYATLLGKPVLETEYNPSLGIQGDILLASPSQYEMIAKGGVQSASSIHVKFVTDETAFRFIYRVDGQPSWNAKVASYYASSDYVSPFVALTASS